MSLAWTPPSLDTVRRDDRQENAPNPTVVAFLTHLCQQSCLLLCYHMLSVLGLFLFRIGYRGDGDGLETTAVRNKSSSTYVHGMKYSEEVVVEYFTMGKPYY